MKQRTFTSYAEKLVSGRWLDYVHQSGPGYLRVCAPKSGMQMLMRAGMDWQLWGVGRHGATLDKDGVLEHIGDLESCLDFAELDGGCP